MSSSSSSTISQSVSLVMQLNNEGIQQLESNNFEGAIKTLSSAIATFKKSIAAVDESDSSSSLDNDLSFAFKLTKSTMASPDDSGPAPFVFDSPIRIAPAAANNQKSLSTRRTHDVLKMLSFALVFNLALAFHLGAVAAAVNNGNNKRKRLTKALAFYKLAMNMIKNENLNLGVMEALAVANNQAHVYLKLGEHKEADQCYDQVRSQIMVVADSGLQQDILLFEQFFATAVVKPSKTAPAA